MIKKKFINPANQQSRGYRFSRLAFWAVLFGFVATLATIIFIHAFGDSAHEHTGEVIKLYLYFSAAALLSLGIFAVKDIANFWTAGRFGLKRNERKAAHHTAD